MSIPRSLHEVGVLLQTLHPDAPTLAAVICGFAQEKATVGVVIGGSYVYGAPSADSDLDVAIVTSDGPTRRKIVETGSFRMDVWMRTSAFVRREFTRRRLPGTLEIFSLGIVALDTEGRVRALQLRAQQMWNDGPPIRPVEIARREERVRHLAAIFDGASPASRRLIVRAAIIDEIVSYWYACGRRYRRAPLASMDEVQEHQPEVARLLQAIEAEGGRAMRKLVGDVFCLIKG